MKIRAITLFADVGPPLDEAQIARLGEFAHVARQAYEADGFKVQTTRLATRVFPGSRLIEFAMVLEQTCRSHGFEYVSLGPVDRDAREDVPDLLGATESLFVTVNVTHQATGAIDGDATWGSDLLQWSALCGTGLDTVPLPGDVGQNTLAALLFDVAALALRLNKPLSARLMPISGKAAGDLVHFDFAYFTDSRVLSPGREGAPGLWPPASELHLSPHSPRPFL
jgi:hypothetical protein